MSKKILIIDDEPDVVTYLSTVIKMHDLIPYSVNSASAAMDMVEMLKPDLICLDIMMPEETGISFYTRLRQSKNYNDIPVIIVSGAVQAKDFDIKNFVADDTIPPPNFYIEKPIDVDKFIHTIERFL